MRAIKMKKTVLILAAISLVFVASEAKSKKPEKQVQAPVNVLVNDVDTMSYALGLNVGTDFAKNLKAIPGGKSNIELLIKLMTGPVELTGVGFSLLKQLPLTA